MERRRASWRASLGALLSSPHAPRPEPVMNRKLVEITGEQVPPESLAVEKARDLYRFLANGAYPYAKVGSCLRRPDGAEVVTTDLSVEVGQEPVHDIQP